MKVDIRAFLVSLGGDCFFFFAVASMWQLIGLPDIIGCYRGRFFAFEVKRSSRLRAKIAQRAVMALVRRAGGVARKLDDSDIALLPSNFPRWFQT